MDNDSLLGIEFYDFSFGGCIRETMEVTGDYVYAPIIRGGLDDSSDPYCLFSKIFIQRIIDARKELGNDVKKGTPCKS